MTDPTYAVARQRCADRIKRSAERLAELCSMAAPALIIEAERQVLARTLILFPVDWEAQKSVEKMHDQMVADEQRHLIATGYLGSQSILQNGSIG